MELSVVEQFLLNFEINERYVFRDFPEYIVLYIIPFFQLVHVLNVDEIIHKIMLFEDVFSGKLIRVGGYITLAVDENNVDKDKIRYLASQLHNDMRF